ncbi:MAG: PEP-CTERM sorting domain-containing protein [Sedimentisphaerales bacterium]
MLKTRFLAVVSVLFLLSSVQATVLWSEPYGSTDYFDWANGQSLNGLFGDPIPIGNTFVFFPSLFRAESLDRQENTVSDTLEFELIAHPGYRFQSISIIEYGDYGILGNGLVEASGTLSVENLDTTDTLSNGLETDLPSIFPADAAGEWQAWTNLDVNRPDWTHIRITLENNLFVVSGFSSGAWIEKKVLSNAIAVTLIPEPATAILLSSGMIFLASKRKRH